VNNNKAPGTDKIPTEVCKTGSSALEIMHIILEKQYG
jgi:hypothetical protein